MSEEVKRSHHKPPHKFNVPEDPETMKRTAENYFSRHDVKDWTRADTCLALGISVRKFNELMGDPKYQDVCEWIQLNWIKMNELGMRDPRRVTGSIYNMKAMGFRDDGTIKVALQGNITIEQALDGKKLKA